LAVANYHDSHGQFPPPYIAEADGKPMHSWRVLILPYLEHGELYDQIVQVPSQRAFLPAASNAQV